MRKKVAYRFGKQKRNQSGLNFILLKNSDMKSHKVCFSFILVLFLLSCSNDHDLDQEFRISEKAASLVETDNLFGLDLFRNVIT